MLQYIQLQICLHVHCYLLKYQMFIYFQDLSFEKAFWRAKEEIRFKI